VYQVHLVFDPAGKHAASSGNRYVLMSQTERVAMKDLLERGKRDQVLSDYKIIAFRPTYYAETADWLRRVIDG
jgi:hypothetical protein